MAVTEKVFSRLPEIIPIPNLVEIQIESYRQFLQEGVPKNKRENTGLESVFNEVFPIESIDGTCRLEYVNYSLGRSKYTIDECQRRGATYAAALKVKVRLTHQNEPKEQEVYMGDLPLMTPNGTFIINGAERVVVSQLHRSPGVSFEITIHPNGKRLHLARIIPYRGAWVEIEFDINDHLYVYIDRRRKFFLTTLLRAMGIAKDESILNLFYETETVRTGLPEAGKRLIGKVLAEDAKSGSDVVIKAREAVTITHFKQMMDAGVKQAVVFKMPFDDQSIVQTLKRDPYKTRDEALIGIFRRLRPGDPPNLESARQLLERLFQDPRRYRLGRVGRHMLNRKLGRSVSMDQQMLRVQDIVDVTRKLVEFRSSGKMRPDDIDHLGNRRVRSVGELLQNQFRIGLARLERSVVERMSLYDLHSVMPHNLINPKLVSSTIKDFFGRSQLSQFMDQTNPLAELTHKRRLSALGPGGLSRERAGFEVRDVHPSHYGRICPIETPEGPNIGLIASMSTYARVNEFGFLETPYRKVVDGRVTRQIDFLSADVEDQYVIAQANAPIDSSGRFLNETVSCRSRGDFPQTSPEKIHYMDVSPKQLVSVAAALIPFLEHDDANRALMGSNMQRQSVPLIDPEEPLIQTGMEDRVAYDSGVMVIAENAGEVTAVNGDSVTVGTREYRLRKFFRTNAGTCFNQRPTVKLGQKVKKGDVLADGPSTKMGSLALGQNVMVAFMPWRGYNFEDAILINQRLISEDIYTSIHIEEFECEARDTKLGNEDITRDIPNVGEDALRNLDEEGIVRIGAEAGPGDILVGKVTPKSETELSPEEKLLRAIFGEKAGDVRDASLTVPPGVEGIVVDIKVFTRKGAKPMTKEERKQELAQIAKIREQYQKRIKQLKEERLKRLSALLLGHKLAEGLLDETSGEVILSPGSTIGKNNIEKFEHCDWQSIKITEGDQIEADLERIARVWDDSIQELVEEEELEVDKIKKGDELPPGVIKKVVVYVASKRKLSVGDKMAGRHGNKGVIAKILPPEDMPLLPDGRPVDIILNPLGVPSRMNIGQILETHLGWAASVLGYRAISPVFAGCSEKEIREELDKAGLPQDGKIELRDGYTGEPLNQKVTVGMIYMMKLAHMVDDKIHARSIGPYSLVTQQPLGGKAQFGGQRFGEMEVWALEAYGSAYTLQELLTVKSDDVVGRTRIYESIVKGENTLQPGTPESFNVLVKELQSLCLDIIPEKRDASGKLVRKTPVREVKRKREREVLK